MGESRRDLERLHNLTGVRIDHVHVAVRHATNVCKIGRVEGDDVGPGTGRETYLIDRGQVFEVANEEDVTALTRDPQLIRQFRIGFVAPCLNRGGGWPADTRVLTASEREGNRRREGEDETTPVRFVVERTHYELLLLWWSGT